MRACCLSGEHVEEALLELPGHGRVNYVSCREGCLSPRSFWQSMTSIRLRESMIPGGIRTLLCSARYGSRGLVVVIVSIEQGKGSELIYLRLLPA